jgi:primary-amine oxidase
MLKPTGFFSANAAGDIPPDRNSRGVLAGEKAGAGGASCCQAGG